MLPSRTVPVLLGRSYLPVYYLKWRTRWPASTAAWPGAVPRRDLGLDERGEELFGFPALVVAVTRPAR